MFNYRLSHLQKSVECAFGIINAKFKIFEGLICCKEESANSAGKAYVILHNFIRLQKGLSCEDDGRQRLSRAQCLLNQLADYFFTTTGAISSQWSYIN
jgi:hypothetical protein